MSTPPWRSLARRLPLLLAALLTLLAAAQIGALALGRQRQRELALTRGRLEARRMAESLDARLRTLEPVVQSLARDLSEGRLDQAALLARLQTDLAATPAAFRLGVVYVPFASAARTRLYAPYAVRRDSAVQLYDLAPAQDYTQEDWYWEGLHREGWGEPHISKTTSKVVAGYSALFHRPGAEDGAPVGMVRMDLGSDGLRQVLSSAELGEAGYTTLVSSKGVLLAHPREDWVADQKTVFELSDALGLPGLWDTGEWAIRGVRGEQETLAFQGAQPILLFAHPVRVAGWSLQASIFKRSLAPDPRREHRRHLLLAWTLAALTASLGAAALQAGLARTARARLVSGLGRAAAPDTWQAVARRAPLALAVLLALLASWQAYALIHARHQVKTLALRKGREEATRMAASIDARLRSMEPVVADLARDLSEGRLQGQALLDRLQRDLGSTPAGFRLGVVYAPFASGAKARLYAPYAMRKDGAVQIYDLAPSQDYTREDWYWEGLRKDGWGEPHVSQTTRKVVAGVSAVIRRPGAPDTEPVGMVRMDLSIDGIHQILASANLGRAGYTALLSSRGVFLAHPREDWVMDQRSVFQMAGTAQDASRWETGEWARRGARGEQETLSYLDTQPIWLFAEPVRVSGWSLHTCIFQDEMAPDPIQDRRAVIRLVCTLLALGVSLGVASLKAGAGTLERLWHWQTVLSAFLAVGISLLWALTLTMPDPPADNAFPLVGQENLDRYEDLAEARKAAPTYRIPTGIFLETLRFGTANDVVVTGHAWQRFPAGYPKTLAKGFIFPDAESMELKEAFQRPEGGGELVEYTFKATVRQQFDDTVKYPFDQAVIHLRMWPKDFASSVGLVPDLQAYPVLNPASLPGVDQDLVTTGWNKVKSYFGFLDATYATTFGATGRAGRDRPAELSFQLVLSRKFLDPFISAMLPVLVVACLLFTLLMAGTKDKDRVASTGYKATDILRAAATLLFPVIYAQISLRTRLAASGLIYLEYFYFVMYAVILLVSLNALAFALGRSGSLVLRHDNGLAKVSYWPVVLGSFFVLSLIFLY